MGYLGRRIGLSQDTGNSSPTASDVGGGILDLFAQGYFQRQGNIYNDPGLAPQFGLTATGGIISDYTTTPGDIYRAHVFTSTGTFEVTAPGTFGDTVEYVVVAGGGGGGFGENAYAGGGGAGGYRSSVSGESSGGGGSVETALSVSTGPTSYTITVGAGGHGGYSTAAPSANGGDSSISGPDITTVTSTGGGAGSDTPPAPSTGQPGGSGGGGGENKVSGSGTANQGYDGGGSTSSGPDVGPRGAGGGGAGGTGGKGETSNPARGGHGGAGLRTAVAGPNYPVGTPGPGSTTGGWLAGGGGGGGNSTPAMGGGAGGPYAGGGNGAQYPNVLEATDGVQATGGGGGGAVAPPGNGPYHHGGNGGSGIVIVRYQIGSVQTAKATGGAISFYGGKTIHTFTGSGTFVCPDTFSETCEYVVIGGGGSGGSASENNNAGGGGGGAGTYRTASVSLSGPFTAPVTIGAGGSRNNRSNHGNQGSTTTLALPSSVASPGGGYGYPGPTPGYAGGSGGGSFTQPPADRATGSPFPGTIGATPSSGWGHPGNDSTNTPAYNGGGGGGAGGAAPPQPGANLSPGGIGIQIPSTFRDPASTVGAPGPTSPSVTGADTSGKYYVAGGGGGSAGHPQPEQPKGGDGGFGGGGDGGGIDPNGQSFTGDGSNAIMNTGSGGGGGPVGDNTFYLVRSFCVFPSSKKLLDL
jgi:hypothetical protein